MSIPEDPRPRPINPPVIPPGWENSRAYLAARINSTVDGFDVRSMDPSDPQGNPQGKCFPTDWPPEYLFGPPSHACSWDPVLQKWGLTILNAAGFINSNDGSREDNHVKGQLAPFHADDPIHPLLREDMWVDLEPGGLEYNAMRPALQLATAILDEPDTLCLFAGLMKPSEQIEQRTSERIGKYRVFEPFRQFKGLGEARFVYDQLCSMRKCLRWSLSSILDESYDAMGMTISIPHHEGIEPETVASEIKMDSLFTEAMQDFCDPGTLESKREYGKKLWQNQSSVGVRGIHLLDDVDPTCANNRTMLLFAQVLLHELGHAVCNAFVPPLEVDDSYPANLPPPLAREPFFMDNQCNEVGHAVVQYLTGGNLKPTGSPDLAVGVTVPFGFHFPDDWSRWRTGSKDTGLTRLTDLDYSTLHYHHPVMQLHVDRMFSRKLWEDDVTRFGISTLRFPRHEEWKVPDSYR